MKNVASFNPPTRITLMRILMLIWIRLITLMRMRILILIWCLSRSVDPDPDFYLMRMRMRMQIQFRLFTRMHPDPSFQIKAQTLKIVLNRLTFHSFWLVICKLMRIRFWIQLITWCGSRFLLDGRIFIWCGCRSGSTTLLMIQYYIHWSQYTVWNCLFRWLCLALWHEGEEMYDFMCVIVLTPWDCMSFFSPG
jgi:hypothetical protein